MISLQLRSSLIALALLIVMATAGCGASFFVASGDGRLLVLVSVDPPSADASQFNNGQVQFTANGTFNKDPITVDSLGSVVWTVDHPAFSNMPDFGHATITTNGLAQCAPDFSGSVTVFATAPANPAQAVSSSNQKVGKAQLICP
jgi:hypothetical protein